MFLWFDRFTRRPGNESVPIDHFLIPLSRRLGDGSGACRRRGIDLPPLEKPVDIGIRLGLVGEVEEPLAAMIGQVRHFRRAPALAG